MRAPLRAPAVPAYRSNDLTENQSRWGAFGGSGDRSPRSKLEAAEQADDFAENRHRASSRTDDDRRHGLVFGLEHDARSAAPSPPRSGRGSGPNDALAPSRPCREASEPATSGRHSGAVVAPPCARAPASDRTRLAA